MEIVKIFFYDKGIVYVNWVIGVVYWVCGNFDLVFCFLFDVECLYCNINDFLGFVNSIFNFGMVYVD